MSGLSVIEGLIEQKLMNVHTAFLAKVTSTNGATATVQPLNMIKQYGKTAVKQSVLPNVPILQNARYKMKPTTISYMVSETSSKSTTVVTPVSIAKGDIVFCVCADRDITEARRGNIAVPVVGRHHDLSDAVIVGVL